MTEATDALAASVDAVVHTDLTTLTVAGLQAQYAAVAPQVQRLTGFAAAVLAELQGRTGGVLPTDDGGTRPLPGWVAESSGDSASAAGRMLRVATQLERGLPRVGAAVLDGSLPFVRAEVLTRLVGRIDAGALLEAQDGLVEVARRLDPTALAHWVRHQLATWVEPQVEQDERRAEDARYLKTRPQPDGSVWGSFRLPAGDAEALLTVIEPLARRQGDVDVRSAAQRRADALTEVCEQVLRHGDLPDAGGARPQLSYVVPAGWAARRADEQSCTACRRCSAHAPMTYTDLVQADLPPSHRTSAASRLRAQQACATAAWTGPQTRPRIEALLCDARVTRVLLDDLGQVTGMEQITEHVTPAQRRALAARDLGCAARGCTRPPSACDVHHLVAQADGGVHALYNLVLLCRRHHVLWHLGKLDLDDLRVTWPTSPATESPPRPRERPLTLV